MELGTKFPDGTSQGYLMKIEVASCSLHCLIKALNPSFYARGKDGRKGNKLASIGQEVKCVDLDMGSQIEACCDPLNNAVSARSATMLSLWILACM